MTSWAEANAVPAGHKFLVPETSLAISLTTESAVQCLAIRGA